MASDAKVSFSSKIEYRAVIRYLYLKGKTGKEIHCELTNVYGSSEPSYAHFKFWVGEFKRSRTSLEDETRSGRPSDDTDEEMCNKVRDLVYFDRRIKVEEIYYEPENKAQSRQSVGPGSLRPKKFKTQPSAGKVMATEFCYYVGLSSKEKYNNSCVLCKFACPVENCDP